MVDTGSHHSVGSMIYRMDIFKERLKLYLIGQLDMSFDLLYKVTKMMNSIHGSIREDTTV